MTADLAEECRRSSETEIETAQQFKQSHATVDSHLPKDAFTEFESQKVVGTANHMLQSVSGKDSESEESATVCSANLKQSITLVLLFLIYNFSCALAVP